MNPKWSAPSLLCLVLLIPCSLFAQVSSERLLRAGDEPQNWLTYSGSYSSQRYTKLQQVDLTNVKNLELKWVFQAQSLQKSNTTPLLFTSSLYLTHPPTTI